MGGDAAQRREFVLNATHGMAVDSVIEIVKAAAEAGGQTISHGLVRMLSKLAEHAELGHEQVRPLADGALRDQVSRLLAGWQLSDPNPDAYGKVLQHLATTAPARTRHKERSQGRRTTPSASCRCAWRSESSGRSSIGRWIRSSATVDSRPCCTCWARRRRRRPRRRKTEGSNGGPFFARGARGAEPFDSDALEQLFPSVSLEGYKVLLDALVASRSRSTRRKLLDWLGNTELEVGPLITAYLEDEHWYVIRNMLMLLQR